jgi:hypothetical protein
MVIVMGNALCFKIPYDTFAFMVQRHDVLLLMLVSGLVEMKNYYVDIRVGTWWDYNKDTDG